MNRSWTFALMVMVTGRETIQEGAREQKHPAAKRGVGLMSSKRPVGLASKHSSSAGVGPLEEGERGAPRIKATLLAA
jgi:hypothetical protein